LKASRTEKHKNRAKEKVVDEIQENTQPQPSDGKVTEQKKKSKSKLAVKQESEKEISLDEHQQHKNNNSPTNLKEHEDNEELVTIELSQSEDEKHKKSKSKTPKEQIFTKPKKKKKKASKKKDKQQKTTITGLPIGLSSTIDHDLNLTPPTGSKWKQVSYNDITLFSCLNIPWIAEDFLAAPYAHFSDGAMDLIFSRVTDKLKVLDLLSHTKDGSYVNKPYVTYKKINALVLDPTIGKRHGILDIDGELIDTTPVAMEVFPGLLKLLSKH